MCKLCECCYICDCMLDSSNSLPVHEKIQSKNFVPDLDHDEEYLNWIEFMCQCETNLCLSCFLKELNKDNRHVTMNNENNLIINGCPECQK